jgi:hypothetical protein
MELGALTRAAVAIRWPAEGVMAPSYDENVIVTFAERLSRRAASMIAA